MRYRMDGAVCKIYIVVGIQCGYCKLPLQLRLSNKHSPSLGIFLRGLFVPYSSPKGNWKFEYMLIQNDYLHQHHRFTEPVYPWIFFIQK